MSSTLVAPPPLRRPGVGGMSWPERLVVGGCLIAPLNLLIVRSLTLYDVVVGAAFLLLWRRGLLRVPPNRYLAAFYVFMLASLFSAFRATHAGEALTQILQYAFVFFVQIPAVLSVVRTRRLVVLSLFLLCLGTLAATFWAFLNQPTQGAGRVLVFYSDNPNRLGYPTVYVLPFLVVLWHSTRNARRAWRLLALAACLYAAYLSIWALFASASRSSLLGTAVALLVFVVVRPGHGVLPMVARLLVLSAVVGAVGYGLIASGALPNTLEERINRSMDNNPQDQAGLVGDRENLAEAGIRAFVAHPYVGTGLDNFRYVTTDYNLFATPQLPHNLWLQLMVQVGAFGTLAMLFLLLAWARDMVKGYRLLRPPDTELLWSVVAAMTGILTIFLFAPEMLDRHYWLIFALGLTIVSAAVRPDLRSAGAP